MDNTENTKDTWNSKIKDNMIVPYRDTQISDTQKFISLKTERLVSAIHLVTGLMDTKESLRDELRSAALSSMNDLYVVSEGTIARIGHITSLLEVGLTGGLISNMNYSILKQEYLKLGEGLSKTIATEGVNAYTLPESFFGGNISDIKKTQTYKTKVLDKKDKTRGPNLMSTPGKTSRQDLIVKVLKDGEECTIKDIISRVSIIDPTVDCSEKTIQRDILSLVASGTLNKRGERRWSRYSKK